MKKTIKITGIVVLVLLVLLFGGQWWLGHKIKHTLEQEITEKTRGRMHLDVGKVSVRLIGRTVSLRDIRITTDTTKAVHSGFPVENLYADIRKIAIKGIHFNKEDSVYSIRIRALEIDVAQGKTLSKKTADKALASSGKQASEPFRAIIEVERVDIRLDDIQCRLGQNRDTVSYIVKDFHCGIKNGQWNTVNTSMPVSCEDMQMSISSFRNLFAEKSQLLEVDSLWFGGKEGYFEVGSVNLIPQYDKQNFAVKAPGHPDWTKVQTGKIKGYRFDMQQMIGQRILNIDSIEIRGAKISSFKNRQIEQTPKVKKLFYESVQQFPVPLSIRTIKLDNIEVEYQELAKNGLSPGTVTFHQLDGTFERLTNIVSSQQPYFTLKAHGKLMDQGMLEAVFLLPVDSLNPHFEVKGSLGMMSMTALNPMIEPLAKIKITSGEIDNMTFDITGNSIKSQVKMVFLYQDLKIRLMKEKDGHLETRSFLTTLANGLLAKGNNPDHREIRKADATAERDIYRSQFNYLWRSLLAGLKISIGL